MTEQINPYYLNHPGAVLSDRDLKLATNYGFIQIKSPTPLKIQPSTIEVHLAASIAVQTTDFKGEPLDLKKPVDKFFEFERIPDSGFVLLPGEFILGVTREWFKIPSSLTGNLDGKSSLGRNAIFVHVTAGFFDPGFFGHATLELLNCLKRPAILYKDMPVGQMKFTLMTSPAQRLYGAKELGSKKYCNDYSQDPQPILSEYWRNFLKND